MSGRGPERYPFQQTGARWLARRDAGLLADEQGIGKTVQAVDAADQVMAEDILVVCKAVAKPNWVREFDRFSNVGRPAAIPQTRGRVPKRGLVVVNYDIVHHPAVLRQLTRRRWDLLICDEMQALRAGVESRRGQAMLDPDRGLHRTADTVWGLSGTPMPGHAGNIHPWLSTLHPGLVPDFWTFMDRYVEYTETPFGIRAFRNRPEKKGELRRLVRQVSLRRKRTEVLPELPSLRIDTLPLSPTRAGRQFLRELNAHPEIEAVTAALQSVTDPEDVEAVTLAADLDTATLRRYIGLAKVGALAEQVRAELDGGLRKIVVMAWHREVITRLASALADYGVVALHGGNTPKSRQHAIDSFQHDATSCRVFIGQLGAAGTSITLTAAHRMILAEADWSDDTNEQAILRILRIGQGHPCEASFAALTGSVDEAVMRVYERKARMSADVFD